MTWDEAVELGLKLPEVELSTSFGTPALKVRGKLLARWRPQEDWVVLPGIGFDERELLMEVEPETFHITPHYKDYPIVLARLASLDLSQFAALLERRWRAAAPRRLAARHPSPASEGEEGGGSKT